jgi:hypothetical protein
MPATPLLHFLILLVVVFASCSLIWNANIFTSEDLTSSNSASVVPRGKGLRLSHNSNPLILLTLTMSTTQINIVWQDNSTNELGFKIEKAVGSDPKKLTWSEIGSVSADVTNYSAADLNPATMYSFRVRAFNDKGYSPYSDIGLAETLPCRFSISPDTSYFASPGGNSSINVIVGDKCTWNTVVSNSPWITVNPAANAIQSGSGTVSYNVTQNTASTPRTGTVSIADQTFTVNQDASIAQ